MNTPRNFSLEPKKNKSKIAPKTKFQTDKLTPKKQSEIVYYSEKVKTSTKLFEQEFINYIHPRQRPENEMIIAKFKKDLSILHDFFELEEPEGDRPSRRLLEIFSLYVEPGDLHKMDGYFKARIKTAFDQSTAFRVFIFQDWDDEHKFKVFLIDPLHLVIPSERQRKEKTFKLSKGNTFCISKLFVD